MSGAPKQSGVGTGALFPPIEVGSFVSLRPDKSAFIGSASGIFFINTVFRAFATSSTDKSELGGVAAGSTTPDPDSIRGLATAAGADLEEATDGDFLLDLLNSPGRLDQDKQAGPLYGLKLPGLGEPPSSAAAKRLLMIYFQKWHPFFPFLHGPSFFATMNRFYETQKSDHQSTSVRETLRDKLCRAVCFQCVFNIAACGDESSGLLDDRSRITSATVLTNILGILADSHDIAALQALLAMELYLITRMSSRAASTVHGTLTRVLYQAGLHRCPFRYVQLPDSMRILRKRIWWCAYVLDRQLSLSLGHPVAISDEEVDVCVPGMPELHNPVRTLDQSNRESTGDEVRAHLPMNHQSFLHENGVVGRSARATAPVDDLQSPAHHHESRPEEAGSLVLGYMVTYSGLVGAALRLFHASIHKRAIALDAVLDLTARIHSWWNSLPSQLQDENSGGASYAHSFSIFYHYLVLFVNRPFLSLPIHREDFRSSLQSALSASRTIISQTTASCRGSFALAWPSTLSSVWMAGLVVAYSSLLKLYPLEKGIIDIKSSLGVLLGMRSTWKSASHCHDTLNLMLGQLMSSETGSKRALYSAPFGDQTDEPESWNHETPNTPGDNNGNKRRRHDTQTPSRYAAEPTVHVEPNSLYPEIWQPVLEYSGPDFGFDTYQFGRQDAWQECLTQGLNPALSGLLFENAGWDSYVKSFADHFD